MKDDDITVEISSPGVGTTGPMSTKEFRELPGRVRKLRETRAVMERAIGSPLNTQPSTPHPLDTGLGHRSFILGGEPDAYFIDFPLKEDFEEEGVEYFYCGAKYAEAEQIGRALCKQKLTYLDKVRIGYLWKRAGGSRSGKNVLGKAVKASALVRTFTDRVGFVVLSADHVRAYKLTKYQMEALIYHELLHFRYDEGQITTVGHDFEAFRMEVETYGLWKPDLRVAADSFKQLNLELKEANPKC